MLLIAGPCVLESEDLALDIARRLVEITSDLPVQLVFKASFDKANRTSLSSYRGPGLEAGARILDRVSSALEMTRDIVAQRYPPTDWNIYAAQASDGDNWNDDSPVCEQILAKQLLPQLRYYAYVEITRRDHQSLWNYYENLLAGHGNFAMQHIREYEDIYPVFREFFRKQAVQ